MVSQPIRPFLWVSKLAALAQALTILDPVNSSE